MALMLLLPLGCIIGWYHQAFANSVPRGHHGYSGYLGITDRQRSTQEITLSQVLLVSSFTLDEFVS